MSECTNYSDDLKALVDGELPFARRWSVERHVAACDTCRAEVAAMRQIGEGLRLHPLEPLDAALRARILSAIPQGHPIRARRPLPRRFTLAVAGSAAAIAALAFLFNPAHQQFMEQARAPVNKPDSASAGAPAAPPAPVAAQKMKRGSGAAVAEANKVQRSPGYRFAEKPVDSFVRSRAAAPLRPLNQGVDRPSKALYDQPLAQVMARSELSAKDQSSKKAESQDKKALLNEPTAGAKFDFGVPGPNDATQAPTPALQAQNAPAPPPVESRAPAGKNEHQMRDIAKENRAAGGRFGAAGGFGGGGGMGADVRANLQEAQRGAPSPNILGALGPRGPQGEQTPAGAVNGSLASGAQSNATVRRFSRDVETRPQPAPTTALLGLEVENVEQKRGEIGQIAKSVNGLLTEVGGADRKDQYRLDVLRAQGAGETELRLEVDPKRLSGVLDKLSKLGEVTLRQVPAPVRQEEKLGAELDNSLLYRSQILDRSARRAARNPQGDSELRQDRARRFGDADKPVRLKSGNIMGRAAAPKLGAIITVLLKEKRDIKPAAAAKPALGQMKK